MEPVKLFVQGWSQGNWTTLWQSTGNQSAAWLDASVLVLPSTSQLRFVAGPTAVGNSFAVDDLQVHPGILFGV